MERNLYYYEYVKQPAAAVIKALTTNAKALFDSATSSAVAETSGLATDLHVELGGLDIGKEVRIDLGPPEIAGDRARIPIRWKAAEQKALFPSMDAELEVEPLSHAIPMTQLSIVGRYRPPLGVLGAMGDALVGHRLAELAVRNFLTDLSRRLQAL